ncbi:MAG TPA: hypothetical protein VH280_07780 [Verrucomicrobiae bacterium]|jgi:hypothetical protein|nr:hypothetical protein [Verrucomicrobiae bacterium]
MKKILFSAAAILAGSLLAAYADPKDDVTGAAQKLITGANYSWQTTVVVPAGSRFKPGPTDGKIQGNMTDVKMSFGDNHTQFIIDGTNAVITDPDDGSWEKLSDVDTQGMGRFLVGMVQNFKGSASQAADLAADAQSLQQSGNSITGSLTADGAKKLMTFGRGRRGGGNGPSISNPSGTVTFWVDGGQLTKFEFHVKGTMAGRDGNDIPVDRDTTVKISDVGTTKIDVPADAKKLLP